MRHTSSYKIICWKVTSACNRKCKFCFDYGIEKNEKSSYNLESLTLRFKELGVKKISITGGEPLMLKDLNNIILTLTKNNIKSILTTNGDFLDEFKISELKKCEYIKISFYGHKLTHDTIMGNGHFKLLSDKIKLLHDNNIEVGVNYLLTQQSIKELDKFLKFCIVNDVKYILLQTYLELNSSLKKGKDISELSINEIESAISLGEKYCHKIKGSIKIHNYLKSYFTLLLNSNLDFEFFNLSEHNFQILGNIYDNRIYNPFTMQKEDIKYVINMLWNYRLETNSIIPIA